MADRLTEMETFICAIPKRRDWSAHGLTVLEPRVLLRVATSDGIEGWGEATVLAQWGGIEGRYYGETVTTVIHVLHDLFGPTLLRVDPQVPRLVMEELDALIVGHPYAKEYAA